MAEESKGFGDAKIPSSPLDASGEYDPKYEPIITLPEIVVNTLEENEDELIKLRAKLFRYDTSETPPEWKERGTGEVKLLHNPEKNTVRVVMRRDKTLKICANHFVAPWMDLKPNCGSDRAWVWSVPGDFADETPRNELLAIKFANAENALKWKDKFEEAKQLVAEGPNPEADDSNNVESEDEDTEEEEEEEEEPVISKSESNGQAKDDSIANVLEKLTIEEKKADKPEDISTEKAIVTTDDELKVIQDADTNKEESDKENKKEKIET